jgi:hypothetical protein
MGFHLHDHGVELPYSSVYQTGYRKGVSGVPRDDLHDGGIVFLAVINFYVRIEIRMDALDTDHSVTDSTQTIAASIQQLSDSVVKSVSRVRHMCQAKRSRGYR